MRTYAGANALASKASHRERKIREQSTFRFGPCFRLSMAKVGFSTRAGISSPPPKLLLYSENCVLSRLGNSEFNDGLGWNPDLLLRLGVEARSRFPLLLHQLPQAWQDEFAVLFNLFVGERAERIEKYSSGFFVGLGGFGKCALKFCLGRWLSHEKPI